MTNRPDQIRAEAAYEFVRTMPLPAFIVDRRLDLAMANEALARTFGYPDLESAEKSLAGDRFFATHFTPDVRSQLRELMDGKWLSEGWLIRGRTLDGRELAFEVTGRGEFRSGQGPADFVEAVFMAPGNLRDASAFMQKAKKEAELASRAKTEFLSNISHELRTPLNIIIGMLDLTMEDESVSKETRANLALAKDTADGLFTILNDLIVLSDLAARRLTADIVPFSPNLLLMALARQFAAQAEAKNITLKTEGDEHLDIVLEGGYNLIAKALEKLVHNAVKFVEDRGEVIIRAHLDQKDDGPWLTCTVSDNGPGLEESFIESQELFRQGDGSMNRKHGGLGLGLSLAGNLATALDGRLVLGNRHSGGAETGFTVPVRLADNG